MIRNFVRFPILPGKKAIAKVAILELAEASKNDSGYYAYDLCEDLEGKEDALYIIEKWENLEVLDKHMKTSHIAAFDEKAPDFVAGSPSVTTLREVD